MKLLTKSRFKLGLECPNKLYYTRKKEYANSKASDPFLRSLGTRRISSRRIGTNAILKYCEWIR